MKEWSNMCNPFNSAKVLLWREHLEACAAGDFLPPVTVSTDPSNRCNFNCIWCNAYEQMQISGADIPKDHLLRLADFYAKWRVKSTCVAGGGEPFLNKGTGDFLLRLHENGVGCAPVTNGSLLTDELIEIIAKTSRWAGISMDAGCCETYMKVKGIRNHFLFDIVINNIAKLTKRIKELKSECDVGYKFLLHPLNAGEIFEAAKLAKSLGINDFQLRPVGWDNVQKIKAEKYNLFQLEAIKNQIAQAMDLEDENFHVYGIRHKFKPNLQRKVNFESCCASPMATLVFGADGDCNLCIDHRGDKNTILCGHFPDPNNVLKYWNSDKHKEILRNINPKDCPRCTIGPYNEIVEQAIIKDRMCRDFI